MLTIKTSGGYLLICIALMLLPFALKAQKLTDPEIASVAVTANQVDVNYGKIALQKSTSPDIRKFAETMISDHESIINQAAALAKKLGVTPKTNAATKSLLDGEKSTSKLLRSKKGKAFDKAYAENEVAYHQAVIDAVKNKLIPETSNAELKSLLESVMPLLEHHLMMAKDMAAKF